MTNFDKLRENLKIEDLFYKDGTYAEWSFLCKKYTNLSKKRIVQIEIAKNAING